MPSRKIIGAAAMTAALATGGVLGATLGLPATSGAQDGTTTTTVPAAEGTPPTGDHGPGRGGRGFGGGVDLDVAADVLGLTPEELRTQLRDGKSLADVAEAEGVDEQAVVDALVAAAEERLDEAKAALPERIAALVEGTVPAGGLGGPGDGPGHGGPGGRGLDHEVAAEALGLTTEELRTQLRDGKSLAAIAEAEGVDRQAVVDALVAAAKERLAQAVTDGKLTQAEADERSADLADRIAEEVDEVHSGGRRGPAGDRPDGPAADGGAPADGPTTTTAPAGGN